MSQRDLTTISATTCSTFWRKPRIKTVSYSQTNWSNGRRTTRKTLKTFYHAMDSTTVEDTMSDSEHQYLLGQRNYLADFSKTGDRSITDVRVWDDIIIYSQLFGFTKKLMKELHQVCPDYANLSTFGQKVDNISIYFLIYACSDSVNGIISSYTSEAVEASLSGGEDFGGGGGR